MLFEKNPTGREGPVNTIISFVLPRDQTQTMKLLLLVVPLLFVFFFCSTSFAQQMARYLYDKAFQKQALCNDRTNPNPINSNCVLRDVDAGGQIFSNDYPIRVS